MAGWKDTLGKALGQGGAPTPTEYTPYANPEWNGHREAECRVLYGLRPKENVEHAAVRDILVQQWIPALIDAPGCISVELADDFGSERTLLVHELWESRDTHVTSGRELVQNTHPRVFENLNQLASFAFFWEGIVLQRSYAG